MAQRLQANNAECIHALVPHDTAQAVSAAAARRIAGCQQAWQICLGPGTTWRRPPLQAGAMHFVGRSAWQASNADTTQAVVPHDKAQATAAAAPRHGPAVVGACGMQHSKSAMLSEKPSQAVAPYKRRRRQPLRRPDMGQLLPGHSKPAQPASQAVVPHDTAHATDAVAARRGPAIAGACSARARSRVLFTPANAR